MQAYSSALLNNALSIDWILLQQWYELRWAWLTYNKDEVMVLYLRLEIVKSQMFFYDNVFRQVEPTR